MWWIYALLSRLVCFADSNFCQARRRKYEFKPGHSNTYGHHIDHAIYDCAATGRNKGDRKFIEAKSFFSNDISNSNGPVVAFLFQSYLNRQCIPRIHLLIN